MTDCLFCKIANKEVAADIIYEDDDVVAFLDVHPLTEGHTMIIPKQHAENLAALPDALTGPLFTAVKRVLNMLAAPLATGGFTIGINHGRIGGQMVDHLHVHIIPRYEGDGGGSIHTVVKFPPKATLEETKNKILTHNS